MRRLASIVFVALLASPALAQHQHDMPPAAEEEEPFGAGPSVQSGMSGALGDYSMNRDSSGTAWQPASAPMEGMHGTLGDWATMLHGDATLIYDHQGGPRGDDKIFSASMLMGMAQRDFDFGKITLRTMLSLDAAMGKRGYPLLLQTGETANGIDPLIDRQHPHDLFMEMSGTYSRALTDGLSGFLYLGYPGEPALGPPTFMHRFSGMADPEAPISHHWLDSTHITYGVVTAGIASGMWKLEASAFNGREPNEERWDFDAPRLDSVSGRVTFNPSDDWSFQASYGFLKGPEQLEPGRNQHRFTVSALYNRKFEDGNWQTTLAWGMNNFQPGGTLDALLLETALNWRNHTIFARAERAEKDELFPPADPLHGIAFDVSKLSVGYVYDIPVAEHLGLGFGATGSIYDLPSALSFSYGSNPMSYIFFTRLKIL